MNATQLAAELNKLADAMLLLMEPEPETVLPPVDHAMNTACAQTIPAPADVLISDAEIAYWEGLADELEAERHPVKIRKMRRHHY